MTDDELAILIDRAMAAHREARFEDEIMLWGEVCAARPERLDFLHNIALAKMNANRLVEAMDLFNELVARAPMLSRVHNNRAACLMRLGADVQELLPAFMAAIRLSETRADLLRHVINACQSAAHGPDRGGEELLEALRKPVHRAVRGRTRDGARAGRDEVAVVARLLNAYKEIARYRTAFAKKEWSTAEAHLQRAKRAFADLGAPHFGRGVDFLSERLSLCRNLFSLLEEIASEPSLTPAAVEGTVVALHAQAAGMRINDEGSVLQRVTDVVGWFLTLFAHQLRYIAGVDADFVSTDEQTQLMMWLSSSSFRSIGDDLISIIAFIERRCLDLRTNLLKVASHARAETVRKDEWARIALFLHGRVFDFRGVDSALAHAALGWKDDTLGKMRADILDFRSFVERQAHTDIFVESTPRENIARALLQAHLSARSYREVPVRGGRSDILVFATDRRRILIETKIWRGAEYHEQGLRELDEYVAGENDDGGLLGAFYIVLDPTESAKAIAHTGTAVSASIRNGLSADVVVVRLRPPTPSKAAPRP